MIDADQPYCADVDECNDSREDFNKLDVLTFFLDFTIYINIKISYIDVQSVHEIFKHAFYIALF